MTQDSEAVQSIESHRMRINELDEQIVTLLNERARESLAIRALKPTAHMGLYDPKREEEIFQHVASVNHGPMYDENLRAVYAAILAEMKELRS